jgi:hypothetical protein
MYLSSYHDMGPSPDPLRELTTSPQQQKSSRPSTWALQWRRQSPCPKSTGSVDPPTTLSCNRDSRASTWCQTHDQTPTEAPAPQDCDSATPSLPHLLSCPIFLLDGQITHPIRSHILASPPVDSSPEHLGGFYYLFTAAGEQKTWK